MASDESNGSSPRRHHELFEFSGIRTLPPVIEGHLNQNHLLAARMTVEQLCV
jgi:hypothetical protein